MKDTIQKAVEGGWGDFRGNPGGQKEFIRFWSDNYHFASATQSPKFWQALGKAMGWSGCPSFYPSDLNDCALGECEHKGWLRVWHRFIDHLAEGKDAESFFKDLLK